MASLDLAYLSIAEAGRRIEAKELSPVALTEASLARIDATDSQVHAFVRLMRRSAVEDARAAEGRAHAGARLSPLDGIPIAVKDLFDTAGVVTAAGTGAYAERVPAQDATAVRRLRDAGAVILGKTNTHELAMGGTTNNIHFGATRNPWDLRRVPGGSSGGSGAALAAGQALGALGTDTGGSIRIPAAFCGVTGHKPTYGLVGRGGVVPLSLTLDHAGPMARSAEDCALLLDVLAGPDERDLDSVAHPYESVAGRLTPDIRGVRVAVIPSLLEGCDAAILRNFEASLGVLAALGVHIDECEPLAGFADDWRGLLAPILAVEAASYIDAVLARRPSAIGEPVRNRLLAALEVRAVEYAKALEARKRLERAYEAGLNRVDAYVLPTCPMVPDEVANDPTAEPPTPLKFRNTGVFDHSHQPAVSVPNGFDADDLPTGLQFASRKWNDGLVLHLAHAYQLATDFHLRRPAL